MMLSAFADEISQDFDEQVAVMNRLSIGWLDLRSVDNVNVLALSPARAREIRTVLARSGIRVATIASPIGKVPLDEPMTVVMDQLMRAIALAAAFDTRLIRIFSFFRPRSHRHAAVGDTPDDAWPDRNRTLDMLATLAACAQREGVVLLMENEKRTYGDTMARCLDVMRTVGGQHVKMILDVANFIQCGEHPGRAGYLALRPWLAAIHVKDIAADGRLVVAGEGMGDWPAIVAAMLEDDYRGIVSLEPHLLGAHRYGGFSGAHGFEMAARAFGELLSAARHAAPLSPQ